MHTVLDLKKRHQAWLYVTFTAHILWALQRLSCTISAGVSIFWTKCFSAHSVGKHSRADIHQAQTNKHAQICMRWSVRSSSQCMHSKRNDPNSVFATAET